MQLNYAIVFVSDMHRSIGFYRDVVGLQVKFQTPEWTEFDTEGATLALHSSHSGEADPGDPASVAAGRCKPGFGVEDLDAFHAGMLEHGVAVVQEPKESFGVRIAQYQDPDGLGFSVTENRKA